MTTFAPSTKRILSARPVIRKRIGTAVVVALVFLWALLAVTPVITAILGSVKNNVQIVSDPLGWPQPFKWSNFATAWNGPPLSQPFWVMAINSVISATVGLIVGISSGTIAAYAVSRGRGRIFEFSGRYFVLLLTIPTVVTWIPLFVLADRLKMLSNPAALGLMYAAVAAPTAAVLMRGFFGSYPLDLIESAKLDGAGEVRTFFKIVLPTSKGSLTAVFIVLGVQLWNELGLANVMLLEPTSRTLPIGLTLFVGQGATDRGGQIASLVLMVLPIIVLYFIFNRQITDGMRMGAIK